MILRFRALFVSTLFVISLFSLNHAFANKSNLDSVETEVSKAEPEPWVVAYEVPEMPSEHLSSVSNGLVYKLVESQVKWLPDGYAYYGRYAYQITDRSGLEEGSKISVEFDPTDTEISFNYIRINRDGEVQDRLPDSNISVLRQEQELDTDIIDGEMTALVVLDDVRKGDVIDYAVSGRVKHKLWPGEYFRSFSLGWSVPVGASRFRLIWPEDKPLFIKNFLTGINPSVDQQEGQKIYSWLVTNPEPKPGEDGTPDWVPVWPSVELSTFEDWQEIQKWAEPYYDIDSEVPDHFKQKIQSIKKSWRKPKDRMTEALRLVQDNIRYVGVEIGLGSHVPRAPMEVVQRGYGDCKDKSVLLVAVLDELGIKAWPALVSNNQGPALPDRLPSPYAFNHAIVKVKIGKDTFWLDPTWSYQGGRGDTIDQPSYAYGLPIGGKRLGLEPMPIDSPEQATLDAHEEFTLNREEEPALGISVSAIYRSYSADSERRNIAAQSIEDYQRSYLDYYNGFFDGVQIENPVTIEDDLDSNTVTVRASFTLGKEAAEKLELWKEMKLSAWAVSGWFYELNQTNRRTDLLMPYLLNRSHRITINMPGYRPSGMGPVERKIEGGVYRRWFTPNNGKLQIDFEVVNGSRSVPPEQAPQAIKFAEDIRLNSHLTLYPEKIPQSYAGVFNVREEDLAPYKNQFVEMLGYINNEENVPALKIANELVKQAQEPNRIRGLFQTMRGEILIDLNRKSSALTAFEEALPLYPDTTQTYFTMAELYRVHGEVEKEIDVLSQLAEQNPEKINDLDGSWVKGLNRVAIVDDKATLFERLALALMRAGYKSDSAWGDNWLYVKAINAIVASSEDAAEPDKVEISKYLQNITSPSSLLDLLISKKYQDIWPLVEARAGKNLRLAIDRNVDVLQQAYENDSKNYDKLTAYVDGLTKAGRLKDAVSIAEPYVDDWDSIEAEAEDAFWLADAYARDLDEMGKHKEAVAVLRRISELPVSDFPSSVNMRINYAHILLRRGKFNEALAVANKIERRAASAYGQMFIDEARVCSLFNTSRQEDARTVILEMEKMKSENILAYAGALACVSDAEKLEQVIIESLEDESLRRSTMLRFIEAKRSNKVGIFGRKMTKRIDDVLSRSRIQSIFSKYGRVVKVDSDYHRWY